MTLRLGTRGSALALAQSGAFADALTAATGEPVELVEIVTDGDRSSRAGAAARRRRLRLRAARGAARQGDRLRRPLVQGPADAAGRRADHRRGPAARRPARRPDLARRSDCWPSSAPAPGSAPGPRAGSPSCTRSAAASSRAVARQRRHPAAQGRRRATSTRSSWPPPACAGSAGPARSPRSSTRCSCCPRPLRARWRWSAGPPTPASSSCSASLDDEHTRAAVTAERSLLATLEAGCSAPVAALADVAEDADGGWELYLRGAVFSLDGSFAVRLSGTGTLTDAAGVGARLAAELLAEGADHVLGEHA